jgi:hypothetical protein
MRTYLQNFHDIVEYSCLFYRWEQWWRPKGFQRQYYVILDVGREVCTIECQRQYVGKQSPPLFTAVVPQHVCQQPAVKYQISIAQLALPPQNQDKMIPTHTIFLSTSQIHAKSVWTRVRSTLNLFLYYISQEHSFVPHNCAHKIFASHWSEPFLGEFATLPSAYYIQLFIHLLSCVKQLKKYLMNFQ